MRQTILLSIALITIITACNPSKNKEIMAENHSFYIGTYTEGESKGIYKYMLNNDGTLDSISLAANATRPSFLSYSNDKKYILAVGEVNREDNTGLVYSFKIEGDQLIKISEQSSGGGHPCFIAVDEHGYILSANYTGGSISLHQIDTNGKLSSLLDLKQHSGSGTTNRQEGPHAHSAWFVPNSKDILCLDLGTNEIWIYHIDTQNKKLIPSSQEKFAMKPGAGPRHLAFHPKQNWIYVINELNNTVTLIKKDENDQYVLESNVNTLPDGFKDNNSTADIHISADGRFLYASNRGHNSIAIFDINVNDGSLTIIGHQSTHGSTPRNFSLSPDGRFLLVANQNSNNIVSFKREFETGLLEYIDEIAVPNPVCILF